MMRFILDCLRTPRARARPRGDEGGSGSGGAAESDERVVAKTAEIRELENAVAVENLELQEQQSDRNELEETLVKLDQDKEKLVQQIKTIRQLCCEESQQILSLQAEESKKEGQVEEYERELARARWRLKKLREEVKQAKRRAEEAGERNTPLQDSIRQSYEEILQEEQTLCSLSGGAVTPDSQLDESTSPADTTEEDPLPLRPWGRSQSLPAYADFVMRTSGSSFSNNLSDTREEAADNTSGPPKKLEAEVEGDAEEDSRQNGEQVNNEKEESGTSPNPVHQLDFYQADPFVHCQSEHDLFNEDLFPKTESSDVFASDPFKGTDPFGVDILFPEAGVGTIEVAGAAGDEADTSLSCADNKASTGTQCFESEFPDEDSDIEISYSREDLDAIAVDIMASDEAQGFKPIQSSSEELGMEACRGWKSQGQYSLESDPNGYELDLEAISPPSDIEELSLGSLAGDGADKKPPDFEQALAAHLAPTAPDYPSHPFGAYSELAQPSPDTTQPGGNEQTLPPKFPLYKGAQHFQSQWDNAIEVDPTHPVNPQNSLDVQNPLAQARTETNRELSFEMSYELSTHSSFDPYGFKLSPEHSSHSLLDPAEVGLSPESNDSDLAFEPECSSSQPDQLNFDPYGFDLTSSRMVSEDVFDPYGFKISPEEENQEVLELCGSGNQEVLEPCTQVNEELLDLCSNGNQEVLELCRSADKDALDLLSNENQELVELCSPSNQEVLEPFCNQEPLESHNYDDQELVDLINYDNLEVLETRSNNHQELLDLSCHENQEVLELHSHVNQEFAGFTSNENQEVLDLGGHDNQEFSGFCSNENQQVLELCSQVDQEPPEFRSDKNQEVLDLGSHVDQELPEFCSNEFKQMLDLESYGNQEVLGLLSNETFPEANNNSHCSSLESETSDVLPNTDTTSTNPANSSAGTLASELSNCSATMDLLGLELSNTTTCVTDSTNSTNTHTVDPVNAAASQELATLNMAADQGLAEFNVAVGQNLLERDLGSVFGAGGYVGCPDVADDLEPFDSRRGNPVAEPVRPVRPPRPSLRKKQSQTQGIDLK